MKYFTVGVGLALCLATARLANADAIYDFSLPANGAVSAFNIQLTFSDLLPAGDLMIVPVTSPVVTSLTFQTPGFAPAASVIGLQITALSTLVGVALGDAVPLPLLFNVAFPGDFFVFNRTPATTGTFSSVSGNVVSVLPLATGSPVGTLSVTGAASVPEPSTVVLLASSLLCLAALRRRLEKGSSPELIPML
jgi:hypothetical protein